MVSFNAVRFSLVDTDDQEYDALPEIGQACGHNLIAIATVGAALASKEWLKEDSTRVGTVKLFGMPVSWRKPHLTISGRTINAGFYKDVDIHPPRVILP